ncbi:MAG: permease [Rhodospirillales bacterium]|jgi:uncharacterized protein|nr:permease [Rhodospirillales bacterium]
MTEIALKFKDIAGSAKRVDRAWLASAVILLGLGIFVPQQATISLQFAANSVLEIMPFLAVAVGVAAYARATGADGLIAYAFQGNLVLMIGVAALFGGLSPFCSCGVIPLIAALLAMGVPLPAVMAFWLASPLMDPSMFVLTMGTLGLQFAIAKTIFAVGLGLAGGYATMLVQARNGFAEPLREGVGAGGCGGKRVREPQKAVWGFWIEEARVATFRKEMLKSGLFLLKWMTLAFLLESVMLAYIPGESIAAMLGGESAWAIPLAVVVGVPAYLNGYAALPLVAGLIEMGTAPGAGMAFLIAGGVTSIPAAIAVWALAKRHVFFWYIALSLAGGLASGLLYQAFAG